LFGGGKRRAQNPAARFSGEIGLQWRMSIQWRSPELMKLNPQQLNQIASRTLDQYNDGAKDFWEGTRGHDVMASE
jgi:hypothetical protein